MPAAGTHAVTVTPPGGSLVDVSCWVTTLTIRHGRDGPGGQPDADTATLDVVMNPDTGPLPAAVEIGSALVVTTTTTSSFTRFAGSITDVALGWDEAGPSTPDNGVGQLVAVGALADLGRRVVGDAPYPSELDGARVSRVMTAAGITLNPATSDPGTVTLLARDIDSSAALDVAQSAAQSASGVLWSTRAGEIRYADAAHRKGIPSTLTLDSCNVLVTPTWRRNLEGLVNEVSIGYGVAAGSEQPRYLSTRPDSIAKYGRYGYTATTELAALADATAMGQLLLVRNGSPVWVMGALPVDTVGLTAAEYDALLSLDVHSLITLTGLPAVGSAPTSASLWVEGWTETLEQGTHTLELVVSGYCRTVPAPRWNDVDPGWLWGGLSLLERRRNQISNPQPSSVTGWSGAGATVTYNATGGPAGAGRVNVVCDGTVVNQGVFYQTTTVAGLPAGTSFGGSIAIRQPAGSAPTAVWLRITYTDATNDQTLGSSITPGPTWARYNAPSMTANPAKTIASATLYVRTTTQTAITIDVAQGILEANPAGGYFDGDTPDTAATDYRWAAAAGASPSVASEWVTVAGGVPSDLTWDDATCMGPPANLGRWDDQPASLRWDQVPPATTWNTFGG